MNDQQRVVDAPQEQADTDNGPQETVLQGQGADLIDRVAVALAMPEVHLALRGARNRLQHAAGCDEQARFQETLLDPRKGAKGREPAVPEWVDHEAVAVNVR